MQARKDIWVALGVLSAAVGGLGFGALIYVPSPPDWALWLMGASGVLLLVAGRKAGWI